MIQQRQMMNLSHTPMAHHHLVSFSDLTFCAQPVVQVWCAGMLCSFCICVSKSHLQVQAPWTITLTSWSGMQVWNH